MSPLALLAESRRLLDQGTRQGNRMAAWLARAACEDAVRGHLDERGLDAGRASMKSQLICLEALDPELARRSESVWSQLSGASHHHAYDLAPTGPEVAGLITEVEALVDDVPKGSTS